MASVILRILAHGLLLVIILSCRKEPDPEFNMTYCHIMREVYKTLSSTGSATATETVTVGGKAYRVVKIQESNYKYDEQGRIISEIITPLSSGKATFITYEYRPSIIIKYTKAPSYSFTDTIRLNSQGLADKNINYVRYNPEGYVTEYYNNGTIFQRFYYEKNNLVRARYSVNTEIVIDQYEYDLSRLGLPNKYPFYGKASQNLPIKYSQLSEASIYYSPGPLSEINFTYTFDQYGRANQQIKVATNLNPLWPGQSDPGGISVTDFTYECP